MVQVLESCNWILGVSQVPNIETWVSVVIVGDHKLGWYKWVPHHLSFFGLNCFALRVLWL
jgi:hypothetical protein